MASSPFGCNQKNLFGTKAKGKENVAPEPVSLVADKQFSVIDAVIPFSTKQAATIRSWMHNNVLFDGQKIFIFRSINGWTNIALDSTENAPKLTCNPHAALKIAYDQFMACNAVSEVTIKWKGGTDKIARSEIDNMEFDALPDQNPDGNEDAAGGSKTDAEVLYDLIETNSKKTDDVEKKLDEMAIKLNYIVEAIDRINGDGSARATPPSSGAGKRRAPPK